MKIKKIFIILSTLIAFLLTSCSLDINNPNSPTQESLRSYDGIKLLTVGLQSKLSQGIAQTVTLPGLVSGETNPSIGWQGYMPLRKFPDVVKRVRLDKVNEYCRTIWTDQLQIVKVANDVLDNVGAVQMKEETRNGVIAFAELSKAMAFYNLMNSFEKIPINTRERYPSFVDRATCINECISLLNDAGTKIALVPLTDEFYKSFIGSGLEVDNLIKAMKARIYLMKGDYANASAAAQSVTKEATFVYDATGYNPLYTNFTNQVWHKALSYWVNQAEKGDKRITEWVDLSTKSLEVGGDSCYKIIKYNDLAKPFKIYTLNEMTLIKAEAYARGGGGDPIAEINKVRTAAGLTAYSGSDVLKQIFIQRFYELYLTGQHWEDLRRFKNDNIDLVNQLRANQLAHEWLVYPDWEVDTNPNAPAQPTNINYGF